VNLPRNATLKSDKGIGVCLFESLLPKVMLPARNSDADFIFCAVTGDVFVAGGFRAWRTIVKEKEMSAWRIRGISKIKFIYYFF